MANLIDEADEEEEILFELVEDPKTPLKKLKELVKLGNFKLNQLIISHPNASKSLIKNLLEDKDFDYGYFLPEDLKYQEMKSRRELSHLLFNDLTKETDFTSLLKMIPLLHDRYLPYIAVNYNTPPGILALLSLRGGDYLKRLIAKNPNTQPQTLKDLISEMKEREKLTDE